MPTIEIQEVVLSKAVCKVSEQIELSIKAVFTGAFEPDEPASLPYGLGYTLGGDEFE